MQVLPVWMLSARNSRFHGKNSLFLENVYFCALKQTMCLMLQRMDLGECPKIHELALRADYQQASKGKDYFYDVEVRKKVLQFM